MTMAATEENVELFRRPSIWEQDAESDFSRFYRQGEEHGREMANIEWRWKSEEMARDAYEKGHEEAERPAQVLRAWGAALMNLLFWGGLIAFWVVIIFGWGVQKGERLALEKTSMSASATKADMEQPKMEVRAR
jgi:hypothetical protein